MSKAKVLDNIGMLFLKIISPTFLFASEMKKRRNAEEKAKFITTINTVYLVMTISLIIAIGLLNSFTKFNWFNVRDIKEELLKLQSGVILFKVFGLLIFYYAFSRVNEVFIAFLNDAYSKIDSKKKSQSTLSYSTRIKLALKSYLELILDYGLIYYVISRFKVSIDTHPIGGDKFVNSIKTIIDAIYFSGVTITTTGYGDILIDSWFKLFSVYEVLNGMLLLVVAFTVYISKASGEKNEDYNLNNKINNGVEITSLTAIFLLISILFFIYSKIEKI